MSGQREDDDRPVSFTAKDPERGAHRVAGKDGAPFYKDKLLADAQAAQFRFRILVVDDEPSIRQTARVILEGEGAQSGSSRTQHRICTQKVRDVVADASEGVDTGTPLFVQIVEPD